MPSPTSAPAPACLDGMDFVADLNYPDNNMTAPAIFYPGQTFQKSWRILNVGTCTWGAGYSLVYNAANPPGSPVGGNPVPIPGIVPPGGQADISVTITAPLQPGVTRVSRRCAARVGCSSATACGPGWTSSPAAAPAPTRRRQLGAANPGAAGAWHYVVHCHPAADPVWAVRQPDLGLQPCRGGCRPIAARQVLSSIRICPSAARISTARPRSVRWNTAWWLNRPAGGVSNGCSTRDRFSRRAAGSYAGVDWRSPGRSFVLFPPTPPRLSGASVSALLVGLFVRICRHCRAEIFSNDVRIAQGLDLTGAIENCPDQWGLVTYRTDDHNGGLRFSQRRLLCLCASAYRIAETRNRAARHGRSWTNAINDVMTAGAEQV